MWLLIWTLLLVLIIVGASGLWRLFDMGHFDSTDDDDDPPLGI